MNVDIQDVSPCKKTLKIEIPKEDVKTELDKIYEELRTEALVPGFRKGRAPQSILKMRFRDYVKGEAIEKILIPALEKAIENADLEILRQLDPEDIKPPIDEITVKEDEPLVFEITVDVKPKIELPDYSLLEVEKGDINVTKERVDDILKQLQEERATFVPVEERPVQNGDYVTVNIAASSGGEVIKELQEQVFEVREDTPFIGISEHLVGMKPNDEREFSISFPEDYRAKDGTDWENVPLAGKEVSFRVTLQKITERRFPELDDDFAKDLGEDDVQHLTAGIWNQLVENARYEQREKVKDDLLKQLVDKAQFEVPEFFVEDRAKALMRSDKQAGSEQKSSASDTKTGEEELSNYRDIALNLIRGVWVFDEIVKREKLDVKDEEIDTRVRAMARRVGKDPLKYRKLLEDANRIESLKSVILENKVFDLLIEKASTKRTLIV